MRPALAQQGQHIGGKPGDGINVGPIVHRTGEYDGLLVALERGQTRRVGGKKFGIDAIAHRLDHLTTLRCQPLKKCGLAVGHKKRPPRAQSECPLVGQQAAPFALVHPRHRPVVLPGVLGPFGRVNIDEIDQQGAPARSPGGGRILGHGGRENNRGVNFLAGHGAGHPGLHAGVAVVTQAQRLAGEHAPQTAQLGSAWRESGHMQAGTQATNRADMLLIVGVVHKSTQEHPVPLRKVLEQVVRTHLVALVGGVRQAVHQVKQVGQGSQPRLRTMYGPSQLASPIGMRRQVAISSLYFALEGLFCGTASRLYRQYS